MAWSPAHLQRVLGQVLGRPPHRERCIWVADDGNHCPSTVLSAVPGPSFRVSTSVEVILPFKAVCCFECRCHSRRPKVWINRILRFLDARLDQPKNVMVQSETHDSALLIHPWPKSVFYSAGVTMCPDEASKSRRDSPKGQR